MVERGVVISYFSRATLFPGWYYLIAVAIAVGSFICIKGKPGKRLTGAAFYAYVFLIIASTVLTREKSGNLQYNLKPFWTYFEMAKGSWRAYRILEQLLLNIVMFIPIGFLLPILLREGGFTKVIVLSLGVSVVIELLQLVTKRGLFEFDDIIHNTLGAIIGYGIYKLVCVLKRRLE